MGIGDWILATAEAKELNEKNNLPVVFAHPKTGAPYWSEVFKNNPRILKDPQRGQKCVVVRSHGGGHRPYHKGYDGERFHWNYDYKTVPGELFLSPEEVKEGIPGAVLIEPHTKEGASSLNKAWPFERWQEVVDKLPLPWVQLGNAEPKSLKRVHRVVTKNFREALAYVDKCSLVVTTDGALHHAAAALGKKAVVLWGGLAPPSMLGYDFHKNICHATSWCGFNKHCDHCKTAMNRITVEEVIKGIHEMRQ
jgi:hypothetical protein